METRANYAAIGLFVLVMLAAGLGFLYWLTNAGEQAARADVRVVFSGPVTGLTTGSAVQFNGIKVGEVAELALDGDDPNTVVAIIRVNRTTPVRTDTRAVLSYQGLTGVANLQLEGGSRNAPMLFEATEGEGIPTILAEVSPFQDILESARSVLVRADSAMVAIDEFVTENRPAFNRTVNNVETFSRALAENSDQVDDVLANVSQAAASLGEIAESVRGTAARAEEILAAVEPERVGQLVDNLVAASDNLSSVLDRTRAVVDGVDPDVVNEAVRNVADAATTLREAIGRADEVLAGIDQAEVDQLVTSLRATSDSVGAAARRADELIGAVNTEQVASIVADVNTAARSLNEATATVTDVVGQARRTLDQVGAVVGAVDPATVGGAVGDVAEAAEGIRQTVERARTITEAVDPARVDAVMGDLSAAADRIGGVIDRVDGVVAALDVAKVRTIVDDVATATGNIGAVIETARQGIARAGDLVASVDPQAVRTAVSDITAFTTALRESAPDIDAILADTKSASESLARLGETVDRRRDDIDAIVQDARTLAGQLNGIAARADGVLAKIDAYVEGDGEGLIVEATETLKAIRSVAETLDSRVGPITDNVANFTNRGLDSYVRLADEGRRALARLNAVLSGIERNPQQFIFGGEGVPEYAPRRR